MAREQRSESHAIPGERDADVLRRLDAEISRRLPQWRSRGPEDPARVLLETFARCIARLEVDVAGLADVLLPRVLAALGHEPRWPCAARAAIRFHAADGCTEAVRVAAGTGVTGGPPRGARAPPGVLETPRAPGGSPAPRPRAVALEGEEVRELPIAGLEEPAVAAASSGAVALFRSDRLNRFLYLGDPGWDLVRTRRDDLVLEWPDAPSLVVEGDWEYSAGGGWRLLPVDFTETVGSSGGRVLRMRVHGPLADLTCAVIEGAEMPWMRLGLDESARATLPVPTIAWLPRGREARGSSVDAGASSVTGVRAPAAGGRAIARVLLESGEVREDHSFTDESRIASRPVPTAWQPAVYLGWDRPLCASFFWEGDREPAALASDAPRLIWEYSGSREFRPLEVEDASASFTRPGTISFVAPDGWSRVERFGSTLFWVRARWVAGSFGRPPRVRSVIPSGVEVVEGRRIERHDLRLVFDPRTRTAAVPPHSDGDFEPFDRIEIRERNTSSGASASSRWKSLSRRTSEEPLGVLDDSVFRLRRETSGRVLVEIATPLAGTIEVRVPTLRVGVGAAADLPVGSLDVLEADVPGLRRISQPIASKDGESAEDRDTFLRRLDAERRCCGRAVTPADYRLLVRAFDPGISRVEMVVSPTRLAEVFVVVIGGSAGVHTHTGDEAARIAPRRLARLRDYLAERAPLGTQVRVVEPRQVPVRVRVEVSSADVLGERLRDERARDVERLESELRALLHPLTGGARGVGSPLGVGAAPAEIAGIVRGFRWTGAAGERVRVQIDSALACGDTLELPIGLAVLDAVVVVLPGPNPEDGGRQQESARVGLVDEDEDEDEDEELPESTGS